MKYLVRVKVTIPCFLGSRIIEGSEIVEAETKEEACRSQLAEARKEGWIASILDIQEL